MENCGVPTYARMIYCCAGIDAGPTVEEQSGRGEVAVFRGHMQERCSLKREAASATHAAIEFREPPVYECGISVNLLSQGIQPVAEQRQDSGRAVPGLATGLEKEIDAGAQPFHGTRVTCNQVVEGRAWKWMAGRALPRVAAVRICAAIEKPLKSGRIQ